MLYLYFFRFSLQLVFGELLFFHKVERRRNFAVRFSLCSAAYFAIIFVCAFLTVLAGQPYWLLASAFIFFWLLTMAAMFACFRLAAEECLFIGTGGYFVQHAGYTLVDIVRTCTDGQIHWAVDNFVLSIFPFLVLGGLFYFGLIRRSIGETELKRRDVRLVLLAIIMLGCNIVISQLATTFLGTADMMLAMVLCRVYALICSFLSVAVMIGMGGRNKLERDKDVMRQLLLMESEQHRVSSENIKLINIKCHDLKHQIERLKRMDGSAERDRYIDEIGKAVVMYDSSVKTGSDTLDLILTEKSLLCERHGIKISCIVDGQKMNFMSAEDMYSLFGNALDNAIEAVLSEPDKDKRLIDVRVTAKNNLVYVQIENRCVNRPEFRDGLPVTTKADKASHGFGVQSIRYIVEKYGGTLRMYAEDDKYRLEILFFGA